MTIEGAVSEDWGRANASRRRVHPVDAVVRGGFAAPTVGRLCFFFCSLSSSAAAAEREESTETEDGEKSYGFKRIDRLTDFNA